MNTYTRLWQAAAGVVTVVGVGAALFTASTSTVVIRCVLGVTLAGLTSFSLYTRPGATPPPRALLVQVCLTHAALGGVGIVAAAGIGAVSPSLLVGMLVALAATAPTAIGLCRRYTTPTRPRDTDRDSNRRPTGAAADDQITPIRPAPSPTPQSMSDEELCWAWRVSFTTLQGAATPAAFARVVAQRQNYLDEFERRNPHGLCAWLESGARAAGNPHKYLVAHRDRTHDHRTDAQERRDGFPPAA